MGCLSPLVARRPLLLFLIPFPLSVFLMTEGILCCSDSKTPSGKFVILVYINGVEMLLKCKHTVYSLVTHHLFVLKSECFKNSSILSINLFKLCESFFFSSKKACQTNCTLPDLRLIWQTNLAASSLNVSRMQQLNSQRFSSEEIKDH